MEHVYFLGTTGHCTMKSFAKPMSWNNDGWLNTKLEGSDPKRPGSRCWSVRSFCIKLFPWYCKCLSLYSARICAVRHICMKKWGGFHEVSLWSFPYNVLWCEQKARTACRLHPLVGVRASCELHCMATKTMYCMEMLHQEKWLVTLCRSLILCTW